MLFTSLEFLLFLSAVFAVYYLIPARFKKSCQWVLLLFASVFFYYLTGVGNLVYLGATIITTYVTAVLIQRQRNTQTKENKKANKRTRLTLLSVCLIVNFGMLAFVKFSEAFMPDFLRILGISFYIFRSMSYVIDLNRGKFTHDLNIFKFALYVSFFPVLIQGPITRFDESGQALFAGNNFDFKRFSFGIQRILWGFFKKLVIADRLVIALAALVASPEEYRGIYALFTFLFWAIILYADFTGGIDITIGIGEALGIPMKENFNRPFFARNIAEYWRRWHITMGTWFRDYVFYPLSVSKPMLKFSGVVRRRMGGFANNFGRRLPVHIVTMVTWFATGIWHGVSWNFIVWGLVNGAVIVISTECEPLYKRFNGRFPRLVKSKLWLCLDIVRTFWLMNFIRAFDLYPVQTTVGLQLSVFTDFSWEQFTTYGFSTLGLQTADYIVVISGIFALFVASYIKHKSGSVREWLAAKPMPVRFAVYGILLFGTLIFGAYGLGYDANQFIYTQF
jgi:D-alanyl-lipoteichoic acid acyltransferase DltB (MBOAT superfamily)